MAQIHPTAVVSLKAKIAEDVEIGPFALVDDDVEIGAGSKVDSHAVLKSGTRIGKMVTVGNHVVVGGLPQDLGFDPRVPTFAEVGDHSTLREGVTVNRATKEGQSTVVGASCFLMANSHIGHDCRLGEKVVMANGVLLAGHVNVGRFTFFGGSAGVHQFCRIGEGVMCGGLTAVSMDVAPYTIVSERDTLFGLNIVGLRRRGVSKETIASLQSLYRRLFQGTANLREQASLLKESLAETPEALCFLEFFEGGKRGFVRPGRRK